MEMKFNKKSFIFVVLMISAVLIGGYLGTHTSSALLSYSKSFGFSTPMTLDLMIITLTLGFTFDISIAQVISIIMGIVVYALFSKYID